jgi:hypothetical protein
VIGFLRKQEAQGRKGWQRLQMVKAIEFYQTAVLGTKSPPLDDIRETLALFVRQHPVSTPKRESVIEVAGPIDPNEPEPIRELRRQLRLLGREYSTERAYVKWARQFVKRYHRTVRHRLRLRVKRTNVPILTGSGISQVGKRGDTPKRSSGFSDGALGRAQVE